MGASPRRRETSVLGSCRSIFQSSPGSIWIGFAFRRSCGGGSRGGSSSVCGWGHLAALGLRLGTGPQIVVGAVSGALLICGAHLTSACGLA
eukprot:8032249-Pyramimonas_sp.AAC.1